MPETLKLLKHRYPTAQTFKFGDSAELSAALLALVRSGKKVATCGAVRDFENGEPMPQIGRRDIALHWDDTPALVIETVELIQCRFDEVTEAMALAEGEDDSLDAGVAAIAPILSAMAGSHRICRSSGNGFCSLKTLARGYCGSGGCFAALSPHNGPDGPFERHIQSSGRLCLRWRATSLRCNLPGGI